MKHERIYDRSTVILSLVGLLFFVPVTAVWTVALQRQVPIAEAVLAAIIGILSFGGHFWPSLGLMIATLTLQAWLLLRLFGSRLINPNAGMLLLWISWIGCFFYFLVAISFSTTYGDRHDLPAILFELVVIMYLLCIPMAFLTLFLAFLIVGGTFKSLRREPK